jgi:hypothetical protein
MKTHKSRQRILILFAVLYILCSGGCSVKQMAVNSVGSMLAEGGSGATFTGENDPELVRDALPFTMKQQGFLVNSVTAEAKQTWQALVDTALSDFMGDGFDPAILSDVKTYVAEYRSKNGE